MKNLTVFLLLSAFAALHPASLWAAPDVVFGSGNTRVEVYYPCNPQNSCNNDCASTYLKASVAGNWTFQCGGGFPITYFNTPYVCFNCTSFNVTFTYNGQSSSAFISVPSAYPNVTANFVPSTGCQMQTQEGDASSQSSVCLLCLRDASTTSASCPIETWKWVVTYDCPFTPTFMFNGPGPHNIPIYPINIKVCLTVTAGCTVKTICKYYKCIQNCQGAPADFSTIPIEIDEFGAEIPDWDIQVAPNPASNQVHISNLPSKPEDKNAIAFFDVLGRPIADFPLIQFGSDADVPLGDIPMGIYMVVVRNQAGKILHTQKLVVN
jgi:hypothetical protein